MCEHVNWWKKQQQTRKRSKRMKPGHRNIVGTMVGTTWGFPKWGYPLNHLKWHHFSIEIHGFGWFFGPNWGHQNTWNQSSFNSLMVISGCTSNVQTLPLSSSKLMFLAMTAVKNPPLWRCSKSLEARWCCNQSMAWHHWHPLIRLMSGSWAGPVSWLCVLFLKWQCSIPGEQRFWASTSQQWGIVAKNMFATTNHQWFVWWFHPLQNS